MSKKQHFEDDGHTVYSMENVEGPFWRKRKASHMSGKERRAAIKAAFAAYTPIFLGVLLCFSVAALVLFFWLK